MNGSESENMYIRKKLFPLLTGNARAGRKKNNIFYVIALDFVVTIKFLISEVFDIKNI